MIIGPEYIPGLGVEIRAALEDGGDAFGSSRASGRWSRSTSRWTWRGRRSDQTPPAADRRGCAFPVGPDTPAKWSLNVRAGFGNDVLIQPCVVPGLDLSVVANRRRGR